MKYELCCAIDTKSATIKIHTLHVFANWQSRTLWRSVFTESIRQTHHQFKARSQTLIYDSFLSSATFHLQLIAKIKLNWRRGGILPFPLLGKNRLFRIESDVKIGMTYGVLPPTTMSWRNAWTTDVLINSVNDRTIIIHSEWLQTNWNRGESEVAA